MSDEEKIEILKRYIKLSDEIDNLKDIDSIKKIEENEKRINKINTYKGYIRDAIYKVKDDTQRNVLQQVYLLGRTREAIAEKLSYSTSQVNRYHKDAIKNINLDNLKNYKL